MSQDGREIPQIDHNSGRTAWHHAVSGGAIDVPGSPLIRAGGGVAAMICLIVVTLGVGSDARLPTANRRAARTDDDVAQYLVLFDGRVMHGRVTESPGGYRLDSSRGRIVIPHEFIRLTATSLEEAYEKQRDNLANPRAGDHISLARWCHANRLYAEAEEQLTAALKLEPQRSEARQLLRRVILAAAEAEKRSWRNSGFDTIEAKPGRSAPGISQAATEEFVRRVQPLLVNKCGNATCHGRASSSTFRLENVKSGSRHQRLESDRNLRKVLAQLNLESPYNSPLLRKPMDNESLVHRGVFFGQRGEDQRKILNDWVEMLAAEEPASPVASKSRTSGRDGDVESHAVPPEVIPVGARRAESNSPTPLTIEIPRTRKPQRISSAEVNADEEENSKLIQRILEEDRPDAFDPDVFNRKVHGGGGEDRP